MYFIKLLYKFTSNLVMQHVIHIWNTYTEFTQASYTNAHNFTQYEISASINTVLSVLYIHVEPTAVIYKHSFSQRLVLLNATFYYI